MNAVKIRALEISACHGVNGFEKTDPQRFIFDVDIETDFYKAYKTDEIDDTLNYSEICKLITEITQNNVFNLIEKLAYECAFSVMENFGTADKTTLTVYKPDAPMKRKFESVAVTVECERVKAYLSLGSSLGNREEILGEAVKKLNSTRGIKVEKVSDYIRTQPYGGVAKNECLNCAVCVSTFLSPHILLDEIHRIEAECGRVRAVRWDDRTLDIDIIFYGDKTVCDETLIIPHPDYEQRDFVKIPLKQIAPHLLK